MPRTARLSVGNTIYHVINRANARVQIFHNDADYAHFESLLTEGKELTGMRILAYTIMPNHWHLVLHPSHDGDMGEFMRWVTTTHVRQRRTTTTTRTIGSGHLYQGAYKSFPVEEDKHLHDLIRYVEQNPLRSKLVASAQDWRWSSLWRREQGSAKDRELLAELPTELPLNYLDSVNTILGEERLDTIRRSVNKGTPFGSLEWMDDMVQRHGLESTTRGPGRPARG